MSDGLNIRKVFSPIFSTTRVNRTKRQNPDARGKPFQKHFEDEKDEGSKEDAPDVSEGKPNLLKGDLGKNIDICI
jgi:hypothetical protein